MSSIILDSPLMPIGPKFSELLIDANSGFSHPSESQLFLSFQIPLSLSHRHLNVTPFCDFSFFLLLLSFENTLLWLQLNWVAPGLGNAELEKKLGVTSKVLEFCLTLFDPALGCAQFQSGIDFNINIIMWCYC